ncbi:glycosyltransferase [Paracoccus bogoriensis]|uniref:glycosyltransferase n=1 Tax=Paracoccus bogoriensis TaxID=242065 RepID=UPI001CA536E1|nr:glycosyltransferase [Paracoccus bogoriensis]MBW7056850.1 glycosyltransferase [Paracoccus bogoriensis]
MTSTPPDPRADDRSRSPLDRLRARLAALQGPAPVSDPAGALAPDRWFYGLASGFRAGLFDRLPDVTGARWLEMGTRLDPMRPPHDPAKGPLVTVVTALFNNPDTLQRCIDSVRAQTWPHVEHIIIDGGSDTATLDILRANADHLAYVVSEPDGGIYSAMNKGIAAARGDFICLLNSDDFYAPDFIEKTVAESHVYPGAIICTDFFNDETHMRALPINEGVLFGNLNLNHASFLVPREIYDRNGPYDEQHRIVSDVMWIRRAFLRNETFAVLAEPLFHFTTGGLSSGTTPGHRATMIREASASVLKVFPALTPAEAEAIYLFRFNKTRAAALADVAARHLGDPALIRALAAYVAYCLSHRANFRVSRSEATGPVLRDLVRLADLLGLGAGCLQVETKGGTLAEHLARIDAILERRKQGARRTILHFVTVFSAPSETFIHDLVTQLDALPDTDNFVLFEHAKLTEERPFAKAIQVHWADHPEPVARLIYRHILDRLRPDVVIGHFALNEWKWAERIRGLGHTIPTIAMCHGIDVFMLGDKPDYTEHVLNVLAQRPDAAFTAVSDYLRGQMIARGIPEDRIHLLPNSVNDRFFRHRKTGGFYRRDRTLRLLAVGRLIDWKGHAVLIDAFARFRAEATADAHLTIVYGMGDHEKPALTAQIARLGLEAHVTLEPFVDFSARPDFYAGFDLFVHPSTYSAGPSPKSETFGVAPLEAIVAGLPVITTDAGGLPEVIGAETRFARIVPHGDADALARAMIELWRDGSAFADNRDYALDRLARFSPQARIDGLTALIDRLTAPPALKVALFSSSTRQGAGYAAYRLHRGLRQTSVRPRLFAKVPDEGAQPDVTVVPHPSGEFRQWDRLQRPPRQGVTIFSVNDDHITNAELLRMVQPYDIINLHWHARFLSAGNVAALTRSGKPVVMTVRDMQPLTGDCHYFHGCEGWTRDCAACPQIADGHGDYPASVLAMKRSGYDFANLTLVALSRHTQDILRRAPFFRDCRIELIPNSIETDIFRPQDRAACRAEFGLPQDRPIIGYVPSFSSEVKGYREIAEAMKRLARRHSGPAPFVMLVGNSTPATESIPFERKALGYIHDNETLARAYACADLVVVPSLEETFSNTTAEAISCGVPVAGFRTGAIPDLVIDGKTGQTAPVGDVEGLTRAMAALLSMEPQTAQRMARDCRAHAEEMLSFMTQARRYEALFRDLAGLDPLPVPINRNAA